MINFAAMSYEAFELNGSVEVCLTKNADTAFSFVVTIVAIETVNPPENAVPAVGEFS